jgi:LacI family transcriptional regulator
MPLHDTKRVLLWIESSRAYGRGCLMGIAEYCRTHEPWRTVHVERGLEEALPDFLALERFDGVISRAENQDMLAALHTLGVPIVDLRGAVSPVHGHTIDTDPVACAEYAFEHFWERGLRNMAFCGYEGVDWSDRRDRAFTEFCRVRGVSAQVFRSKSEHPETSTLWNESHGEIDDPGLTAWLAGLPKPSAVFAANDVRGRQVLAACAATSISVPEQIAVLGVDNDEVVCELAHPPLSSIDPDTTAIGFAGASTLDRLMRNDEGKAATARRLVRPRGVVTRLSTDIAAIDDFVVAKAVGVVREVNGNVASVDELASLVGVSRATLERRFRATLNRSPRQEIDRVRLERARALVTQTTYSLQRVAQMIGYSNASRLIDAYRRRFGVTPGADRDSADTPRADLAD